MRHCALLALFALALGGCSSSPSAKPAPATRFQPSARVSPSSNPVAKYIEITGFRITEKGPGKLLVRFAVVNHSDADIGNLVMTVNLRATTSKPGDAPLASFNARVEGLGPEDLKEVSAEVPTKLRVYELPDWQFIQPDFQIVEPK